jgi:hypothetical protein
MRQLFLSVAAILAIFFAVHVRAQIEIPNAQAAGTGCPAGTSLIGITQDSSKIVALFDEYTVSVPRSDEKVSARKSCNLAIPVSVPKNTQLVIKEIAFQNDVNLPRGAKSTFNAEIFYAGTKGVKASNVVKGPQNRVRTPRKRLKVVSECGKDQIIRVNTAIVIEAEAGKNALSGIRDKLELKLAWQRCR